MIALTVRNALADSTIFVHGFATKPAATNDSVAVPPGETRTIHFAAGRPGTYLYYATAGTVNYDLREREQLTGALVVDEVGAGTDDRIFVLNIWGEPKDSVTYPNALAINGKTWPYTERIMATVGDSLHWRVINGTTRNHPMHLHGFYFRVDSHGTFLRDSVYPPGAGPLVVTEDMSVAETMRMAWQPNRPGNWLFHCHITFHVIPDARLVPSAAGAHDGHAVDARRHMAGLVLGISVRPGQAWVEPVRTAPRQMHLFVNEGPRHGRAPRALAFVLQQGGAPPAVDSVEIPSSVLLLTRDEPTDITVVNRLPKRRRFTGTGSSWRAIQTALRDGGGVAARLTLPGRAPSCITPISMTSSSSRPGSTERSWCSSRATRSIRAPITCSWFVGTGRPTRRISS